MLAAIVSVLAALMAWVVVLVPAASGDVRGNPVFWLLALPVLAWTGPLLSFREWALRSVPLILVAAPLAALGALETALAQRDDILFDDRLDTPTAMLAILGISIVSTLAGLVALRRSSLPGGTRPVTFAAPGSLPPGLYPLPNEALWSIRIGSLAVSGALVNGVFFAIVALLDTSAGTLGPVWPVILPVAIAVTTLVLVIRGTRGLVRRRKGARTTLGRGWMIGAGGAALEVVLVWAWPTDITLKLAFSAFMLPMALAAAWGARRALRGLRDANGAKAAERLDGK